MQQVVTTLDDYGKPAWIIAAVLGFIIWWPIGLGLLAYLIWSGRMGCGNKVQWKQHFMQEARRFGGGFTPFRSTGNAAFDEYREETLRRLEEEAQEFQTFLDRLRKARDKAEFDQFMQDRKAAPKPEPTPAPEPERKSGEDDESTPGHYSA